MRPQDPPPLLLLATYRIEEVGSSPLLQRLFAPDADELTNARYVELLPLSDAEAGELVTRLHQSRADSEPLVELAAEAGGHPMLIAELVRYAENASADVLDRSRPPSVDEMLGVRIAELPSDAREFLRVVCVAGRPTSQQVLEAAGDLNGPAVAALAVLDAQNLIRTRGGRGGDTIEAYHDRVRESVVNLLPDLLRREYHRRIALALERYTAGDSDALVEHWLAAGERERAASAALQAARAAETALAFDLAARMYEVALGVPRGDEEARRLRERLGDALANAGRGSEAAEVYLAACAGAPEAHGLELRRRAATESLRSGNIDRGVEVLTDVMSAVGLRLASTPRRALMSFLFKRALLRLRGYGFRRRDEGSVAREDLARIDVGWTGAAGIGMVDPILGAEFQARHVLMALRSGEPYRVLRAMSIELAYQSLSPRTHRRAAKVLAVLRALLREADVPEWRMLAGGVETYYWYSQGEFSRACEVGDEAIELARDACTGVRWELVSAELYRLWSQYWMGDISPMSKRIHFLRREAASLGDRYAGITLRSGFPAIGALLANGSTQHLRLHVRHAMDMWPKEGFHLEHLWASAALAHAELYSGDGERAYAMVTEMWPALRRSMLMHVGMITIDCLHLRARCAIAASSGDPKSLRRASRDAHAITRAPIVKTRPLGTLLLAQIAAARGRDDAPAALLAAAAACSDSELHLFAAAARYRAGELLGGDEGATAVAEAAEAMRERGVRDPSSAVGMLAPIGRP